MASAKVEGVERLISFGYQSFCSASILTMTTATSAHWSASRTASASIKSCAESTPRAEEPDL